MSTTSMDSVGTASTGGNTLHSLGGMSSSLGNDKASLYKCPNCFVPFDHIKRQNGLYSKIPLILNCKHTVCEDCIQKAFTTAFVTCPVCDMKSGLTKMQLDKLPEVFTPHFALIGYLVWKRSLHISGSPKGMFTLKSTAQQHHQEPDDLQNLAKQVDPSQTLAPFLYELCPDHAGASEAFINIFCTACNEKVCCYCFVENHMGHAGESLYKLNKDELSEINQLKICCSAILRQLQVSYKNVKRLTNFDNSDVEADISEFFVKLQARLHHIEKDLKQKLSKYKGKGCESPDDILNVIRKNFLKLTQLSHILKENDFKKVNIKLVLDQFRTLKDVPCRLISNQESIEPVRFSCSYDFDNLEQEFRLEENQGGNFELGPIEDWDKLPPEPIFSDVTTNSKESEMEQGPSQKPNKKKKHHSTPLNQKPSGQRNNNHHKNKQNPNQNQNRIEPFMKILVTHFIDMECFYVQKCSTLNNLRTLNCAIEKKRRNKLKPEDVELGHIYGVLYVSKGKEKWRRGKVTSLSQKSASNIVFNVKYIDYGNTDEVTIEKIKTLDMFSLKEAPYAIEVAHENADTESGIGRTFSQFCARKELYMQEIRKLPNDVPEIQVLIPDTTGSYKLVMDLLRPRDETLQEISSDEEFRMPEGLRFFKNSKTFSVAQREDVVITHIEDPHNICVQIVQNIGVFNQMQKEIKDFYENKPHCSCVPVRYSNVIVNSENPTQGNWHRGRVLSVDIARKEATVLFVDWGGEAVVSWDNIRMLNEKFTRIECQGIYVRMADVEPTEATWSKAAIKFLCQRIGVQNMFKMAISNADPVEVLFFENDKENDICLNAVLVKYKYAKSSGKLSSTVEWPNESITEEIPQDDEDFASQLIRKSETQLMSDINPNDSDGKVCRVSVVHVESPDLIYVKFAQCNEQEEEMHNHLKIHFSQKRQTKSTWSASEYCVYYDSKTKNYFRGIIKSEVEDDIYGVYLYDHAKTVLAKVSQIYVQDKYFMSLPSLAYKCRLAGIKSTGGNWSILSMEILQKIFQYYKKIFVKKIEGVRKDGNNLMGIQMWYLLTIPGEALQPSTFKYVSVNETLMECGVAFGVHRELPSKEVSEKTLEESTSTSDSTTSETDLEDKSSSWYDTVIKEQPEWKSVVTWPPPLPLSKREFPADIICIDSEGVFSIRDKEYSTLYKDLEENLKITFDKMPGGTYVKWKTGDLCTISYEGAFYRGVVVDTLGPQVHVEMIDFGSAHFVDAQDLYKEIMFPDMPPLIHKVQLYDICSKNNVWPDNFYDELFELVEDNVRVVVEGELVTQLPEVEIYRTDGTTINDEIVKSIPTLTRLRRRAALVAAPQKQAEVCEDEKSEESGLDVESPTTELQDENSVCAGFAFATLPCAIYRKAHMRIASVPGYRKVILNVSDFDVATWDDFVALSEDIQLKAPDLPMLEIVRADTPCVCYSSKENMWCRGIICGNENLEGGYAYVFLVDLGTMEMIDMDDVRVLLDEWSQLRVYHRVANVAISSTSSRSNQGILNFMKKFVGQLVNVKVLCFKPLTVHMYHDKNVLIYQDLLTKGQLEIKK